MSVMPVTDQAPQEQSVEERIASRFGGEPQEAPAAEEAPVAEDLFELEWDDGKTYKLPVALKDGLMRQKDYTQKTQEVSEQRKNYELARELAETASRERAFAEQTASEVEELAVIKRYLTEMKKSDWSSLPMEQVMRQKMELDNVKERRAELEKSIADKRKDFDAQIDAKFKELRGKAKELASKSISGFGEETEKSMRSYAASVGLTDSEFDRVSLDPRSFRVMHDAMQYQKVQASAKSPVVAKTGVLKPGPASERMPPDVVNKLNFNKALAKARTNQEKSQLIEERLTSMFAKRK